ncbi:MAG: zinc finger CCCH domain-containing protein, partial [Flavobacteriia bacterium]|nr:zinc finger CCCH domain-containing protein [Flavobacteriia bacterium]
MASSIDMIELAIAKLTGIKENMSKNEIEIKLVQATRVLSKAIGSFSKEGVTPPCLWAEKCVKLIEGDDEIKGACTHIHMKGEREMALKFKGKKFMKPEKADDDDHAAETKPKNKSKEKTVDCMYFAKGECNKGDKCTFIHNEKLFTKTKSSKTDDDKSVKSKKATAKTYARAAAGGGGEVVVEELDTDS